MYLPGCVSHSDFPWLNAGVGQCDAFDAVAPLFGKELQHATDDVETPEWTAEYERIRAETRLTYPDGRDVAEYLLAHRWRPSLVAVQRRAAWGCKSLNCTIMLLGAH